MKWTDEGWNEPNDEPHKGAFTVALIVGGAFMAIIAAIILALVWLLSFVGYGCGA